MKSFARPQIKRAGAAVVLGAALLSATGCGYFYQQPTTIHYAASDGINADVNDQVKVRNLMVISQDEKSAGRLLGTVVNDSDQDAKVTVDTGDATAEINAPANSSVHLENLSGAETPILDKTGAQPGKMLENTKISADGKSTSADVPVLDGTLEEYKPYLPNLSESEKASEQATPSGQATESQTAAP